VGRSPGRLSNRAKFVVLNHVTSKREIIKLVFRVTQLVLEIRAGYLEVPWAWVVVVIVPLHVEHR